MSTVDGYLLSPSERTFLREGVEADIRADGRTRLLYRPLDVEYEPVPQANGSAKVSLGNTEVLVAVKGDIIESKTGRVEFSVDTSCPSLSQLRESEDVSQRQEENKVKSEVLSRIFENSLDLGQLVIAEGRFSWILHIDVLILNNSGNLLDVMACAVRAALSQTRLPRVMIEEGEAVGLSVSEEPSDLKAIDCDQVPVVVTFVVFQGGSNDHTFAVDPNSAEEASADCLLSIAVDSSARITFVKRHFPSTSPCNAGLLSVDLIGKLAAVAKSLSPSILSETSWTLASSAAGK